MLEKGDLAIVKEIDRNNVHPAGTIVEVIVITSGERGIYCQSTEGRTAYNYSESELEKINE